jgi:hypothetical protein
MQTHFPLLPGPDGDLPGTRLAVPGYGLMNGNDLALDDLGLLGRNGQAREQCQSE